VPVERYNEVIRLRQELREQLRLIQGDHHRHHPRPGAGEGAGGGGRRHNAVVAAFEQRYYIPLDRPVREVHIRPHAHHHAAAPRRVHVNQVPRPVVPEAVPDFNEVWDLYQQMELQHGAQEVRGLNPFEDAEPDNIPAQEARGLNPFEDAEDE